MKRIIVSMIMATMMIVSYIPTIAFAESNDAQTEKDVETIQDEVANTDTDMEGAQETTAEEFEISSLNELKSEIKEAAVDNTISKREANDIISRVAPEVMEEYIEFVDKSVSDEVNSREPDEVTYDPIEDKSTETYYVDVDGLSKAELILIDQEELSDIEKIASRAKNIVIPYSYAATNGEQKWKYYKKDGGKKARYFTASYKRWVGAGYGVFCTENHYYVSSKGLQERYGSSWVSEFVGITVEVTGKKHTIEDEWAKSKGEDAHIKTIWNLKQTVGVGGNNVYHYYTIKERTKIKYIKKDAANHRILVEHTWSKIE